MFDLRVWLSGAESAIPGMKVSFDEMFEENEHRHAADSLEISEVGLSIMRYMENRERWVGGTQDLMDELAKKNCRLYAKGMTAEKFHFEMMTIAPTLETFGVTIRKVKNDGRRWISMYELERTGNYR